MRFMQYLKENTFIDNVYIKIEHHNYQKRYGYDKNKDLFNKIEDTIKKMKLKLEKISSKVPESVFKITDNREKNSNLSVVKIIDTLKKIIGNDVFRYEYITVSANNDYN